MISQIAYVRSQIHRAQQASTPSARADHLQRALDGLQRVEAQARDVLDDLATDPFLPLSADERLLMEQAAPVVGPVAGLFVGPDGETWTVEDVLRREG